jgi:hypothetical protein
MSRIWDLFGDGMEAGRSAITRHGPEKWFAGYRKEKLMTEYEEWEGVGRLIEV